MSTTSRPAPRRVLVRAPKNKSRASLLWLVEGDAITLAQADRLDDIYAHRHDLSHELIKYVVHTDFKPEVELLTDALAILNPSGASGRALKRTSARLKLGDVDLDEVTPLALVVLQMCIDAYVARADPIGVALPSANWRRGA